jgi:LysR family transcriptional regulator, cyn operon transcriptional activator
MLNLKHLYYFHIFAQEFSTSRAAKRLGITPPALSNQLKQLEETLGLPLTRRYAGRVICTEHGELVLKFAKRMFEAYEELEARLLSGQDGRDQVVRIGVCSDLHQSLSFDPPLLSRCLGAALPSDRIQVTFDSAEKLFHSFIKDQFDTIFGAFDEVESEPVYDLTETICLPVRVLAPKGSRAPAGSEGGFAELLSVAEDKGLFFACHSTKTTFQSETEDFLRSQSVQPKRRLECNSASAIVHSIEAGQAIGFMPIHPSQMQPAQQSLECFGPVTGFWEHRVSVLTRRSE